MRASIAVCLFLAGAFPAGAQEYTRERNVPDDEAILVAVTSASSPYYYPALYMRYEAGDTTLTLNDYHYLYYGRAWQEGFSPLDEIPAEKRMAGLLTEHRGDIAAKAREITEIGREVMRSDPFSPRNVNLMAYACNLAGDTIGERVNGDRLQKILAVIEWSGTGESEKSPWHVTRFSHVNDYLAAQGLVPLRRTVRTKTVEYVELKPNAQKIKGYYFDFGRVYRNKPTDPPQKKKGLEVNKYRPVVP